MFQIYYSNLMLLNTSVALHMLMLIPSTLLNLSSYGSCGSLWASPLSPVLLFQSFFFFFATVPLSTDFTMLTCSMVWFSTCLLFLSCTVSLGSFILCYGFKYHLWSMTSKLYPRFSFFFSLSSIHMSSYIFDFSIWMICISILTCLHKDFLSVQQKCFSYRLPCLGKWQRHLTSFSSWRTVGHPWIVSWPRSPQATHLQIFCRQNIPHLFTPLHVCYHQPKFHRGLLHLAS